MRLTAKRILKEINCPFLKLYQNKSQGYWYFVYDDTKNNVYANHSVMTMYMNGMTLDQWVEEAQFFLKELESE